MDYNKSGSYINIGLVFCLDEHTSAEKKVNDVLYGLLSAKVKLKSCRYSKDLDGECWITIEEGEDLNIPNLSNILINNYYGQIEVLLGCNNTTLSGLVSFHEIDDNYYGILLEIPEQQLLLANNSKIIEAENWVIRMLLYFYNSTQFVYGFCDNEAEIEYGLKEIRDNLKTAYSIIVIPKKGELQILKNNWCIDGLTKRQL